MDIEIRKLTPKLAEEYARFFDITPHDVNIDERKCYCVTWRSDCSYEGNDHWYPAREERRSRAIRFIKEGSLQGYLAYQGDEIVGWCNATGQCRLGVSYLRSFWPIEEHDPDTKVMSVFCFMIAPQAQRMGVATRLLERVCLDAAADGFDFVEAYTNAVHVAPDFRGPLSMYEKLGFSVVARADDRVVVRKALK